MMNALSFLKNQLNHNKQTAIDEYLSDRRPLKFFRHYTRILDEILETLWQHYFFEINNLSLLAVGGYGREEVYPYSDVDLVIVSLNSLNEKEEMAIMQLTQYLWDLGLKPAIRAGSLKELSDLAKQDLSTDTALLESRFLMGNIQVFEQSIKKWNQQRDTLAFVEGKILEMQQRHAKQPTLVLEPNIKNCAGGLRDIHTMMWLAKVQNLSSDFNDLLKNQILNHVELGLLKNSLRTLARLRIDIHLAANREEERLVFDLQGTIAMNLNLNPDKRLASEALMKMVYRALKTVLQLNGIIVPMLRGRVYSPFPREVIDIDEYYYQVGKQIAVRDLKLFEKQPEHLFQIIALLQKNPHLKEGIAPKTLRAWWIASQRMDEQFYHNPLNRKNFLGFFQHEEGLTQTMRFLNVYGVLARYLPDWKAIVGLLQHDLFHIYPVDDHILMVLRNMRRFDIKAYQHELPFASSLMMDFQPKYILYLAALFHDIAKGRNGEHEKLGMIDARRFAQDHDLPKEDADLLVWLVGAHLLMSQVSQKQDINDVQVVQKFCAQVPNHQYLTALYLLTVADIRGTNPKIWNHWKAQLLERLFHTAWAHLAEPQSPDSHLSAMQQAYLFLENQGIEPKKIRKLWQSLGDAYFVRHDIQMICWHLPFLADDPQRAQVQIRSDDADNTLQILVFMPNAERLFTRICRILSKHQLDIVSAYAFVTEHHFILDTFRVCWNESILAEERGEILADLQRDLEQFMLGEYPDACFLTAGHSAKKTSRRARSLPLAPSIFLEPTEQNAWYHLEIITANRPALLADISEVFAKHGVSLRHANIFTLADRVEDSFLIYCPQLDNALKEWELKQDLLAQL